MTGEGVHDGLGPGLGVQGDDGAGTGAKDLVGQRGRGQDGGAGGDATMEDPRVRASEIREHEDIGRRRPGVEFVLGDEPRPYLDTRHVLEAVQFVAPVRLADHQEPRPGDLGLDRGPGVGQQSDPFVGPDEPKEQRRRGPVEAQTPAGFIPRHRLPAQGQIDGDDVDADPRGAGLDETTLTLAVDDHGVGHPPTSGLTSQRSRPSVEGLGIVGRDHHGNPPGDGRQGQVVETRHHLRLDVDDVTRGPQHGPSEQDGRRPHLGQPAPEHTEPGQSGDVRPPPPVGQSQPGIGQAGRGGQ